MAVHHMVWMKFHAGVGDKRIDEHLTALRSLPADVPGIRGLNCGVNFTDRAGGYTHGLSVVLDDREALGVYAEHPRHVEVATALRADADLMALDYEF
ncbi:MAG: Dabb family protein [Pseudomonadota bacterium]